MEFRSMLCLLPLAVILLLSAPAGAMESEDCLGCHTDKDTVEGKMLIDESRFDSTAHAELGCPSCHESVTDEHPDDGLTPSKASCQDCHDEIHQEYAVSRHGANAECNDCHNPHQVKATTEVSGYDMNRQCASCHDAADMVSIHDKWLPQAELHLGALPCITCHSASEDYVISLYISSRAKAFGDFELASEQELKELAKGKPVQSLIDTNGDSFISLDELRTFNQDRKFKNLRLAGMMTPEKATHNFEIFENRWDCTFCHASGPDAMQTSYVAFPGDGTGFNRMQVEQGAVLDALYGTPDFYMMGATRSSVLNIAGLMIIAGGLVMPIGHGSLRILTRKNRQGKDH